MNWWNSSIETRKSQSASFGLQLKYRNKTFTLTAVLISQTSRLQSSSYGSGGFGPGGTQMARYYSIKNAVGTGFRSAFWRATSNRPDLKIVTCLAFLKLEWVNFKPFIRTISQKRVWVLQRYVMRRHGRTGNKSPTLETSRIFGSCT
jgi:hypothetical protein